MRVRSLAALLALGVAVGSAALAPEAHAAAPSPADVATAKKLFEQGLKLYREGSFREALAAFQHASDLAPRASIQRNIAQCHRDLKDFAAAHDAYEAMLATYGPTLSPADRLVVQRAIEELAMLTGTVRVALADAGATVNLDGRDVGQTPLPTPLRLNLGAHTVTVSRAGFETLRREVTLRGGDEVKLEGPMQPAIVTGHLTVRAPAAGPVEIFVDGVDVGPAPWEGDLGKGVHAVEGRTAGHVSPSRRLELAPHERSEVVLDMAAPTGRVQIDAHAVDASISVDGARVGTGAWEGTLPAGEHRLTIEAPGSPVHERTFVVHAGETFVEDARLGEAAGAPRYEGIYSGLALFGFATPTGASTFVAQSCPSAPCQSSSPLGGGLAVRVGYALGWLALEGMALGTYDYSTGGVTYPGTGLGDLARTEDYSFHRFGGGGAVGVRAATKSPRLRLTASALAGVVVMANIYKQSARAAELVGGGTASNTSATTTYTAPLLALDAGVLLGWPGGAKVHVGLLTLIEVAGGPVMAPGISATSIGAGSYVTPSLQVAGGTQVFMGPVIGFDLGL